MKISTSTIDILDLFLGLPESLIDGFNREEFYRIMKGRPKEKRLSVSNICKLFNNFKKSGYIETSIDECESVRFTNKAKLLVVDRLARRSPIDNKYRFVSFDIPEKLRTNRDLFRRAIKRMGFKQIQKSLWVNNRDVGMLVELASKEYKVEEYIVYIAANNTNINNHIESLTKKG